MKGEKINERTGESMLKGEAEEVLFSSALRRPGGCIKKSCVGENDFCTRVPTFKSCSVVIVFEGFYSSELLGSGYARGEIAIVKRLFDRE